MAIPGEKGRPKFKQAIVSASRRAKKSRSSLRPLEPGNPLDWTRATLGITPEDRLASMLQAISQLDPGRPVVEHSTGTRYIVENEAIAAAALKCYDSFPRVETNWGSSTLLPDDIINSRSDLIIFLNNQTDRGGLNYFGKKPVPGLILQPT